MGLTEEQKERIRLNRERALELRKRKLQEEAESQKKHEVGEFRSEKDGSSANASKRQRAGIDAQKEEEEDLELEAFEEGASEFVTKQEAQKMYCLPAGTLAVCEVTEKPNPRNGSWTAMKLYRRAEVRYKSRERFGGLAGLVAERRRREEKRFEGDMERMKDVFKN